MEAGTYIKEKGSRAAMAHRNVAAAGLIHIRGHSGILTTVLAVSLGVAVQVTSITALNARPVPTSISFWNVCKRRAPATTRYNIFRCFRQIIGGANHFSWH